MDNYIRVYDNVMSGEKCQHLIDMFESDTEHHQIQDCGSGATLTQINLLHSPDTIWRDEVRNLTNVIKSSVQQYKRDCDIKDNQWPTKSIFEPPKIAVLGLLGLLKNISRLLISSNKLSPATDGR